MAKRIPMMSSLYDSVERLTEEVKQLKIRMDRQDQDTLSSNADLFIVKTYLDDNATEIDALRKDLDRARKMIEFLISRQATAL